MVSTRLKNTWNVLLVPQCLPISTADAGVTLVVVRNREGRQAPTKTVLLDPIRNRENVPLGKSIGRRSRIGDH
eukprot:scaffold13754_cov29-Cylindrotheca_fusiformis.AAC.1